jgi:diaminopimelate decarboxylase
LAKLTELSRQARPFHYDEAGALCCERMEIAGLAKRFGTPLYVYSGSQIRARLQLFRRHFRERDHLVCYAVKANSNLSVLKLVAEEGAGFDIVSGGELERVLRAAPSAARRTVFSGVGKTAEEMRLALDARILLFNVESEAELELLEEQASRSKRKARIALRVNPDVFAETHPYISTGLREHKFGIDIDRARAVYGRAAKSRWLEPSGVSVHIGSQIRSAEPFQAALVRVSALMRELAPEGIDIRFVDAGGGLGIDYHAPLESEWSASAASRPGTFDRNEFEPKAFDAEQEVAAYAGALQAGLAGLKLRLLLEPGRFVVAQAGALITRVLLAKQNGTKRFLITDAGMNDLLRPSLYGAHHEIVPVQRGSGAAMEATEMVDVVGPVCETGDFFARDRVLPRLEAGELAAILDAGAYGMSLASNYNTRGRAAEVLVEGKRARLVRRRETVADQLRLDTLGR